MLFHIDHTSFAVSASICTSANSSIWFTTSSIVTPPCILIILSSSVNLMYSPPLVTGLLLFGVGVVSNVSRSCFPSIDSSSSRTIASMSVFFENEPKRTTRCAPIARYMTPSSDDCTVCPSMTK